MTVGGIHIANMLYYFCMYFGGVQYPLAMVDLFLDPDEDTLLELSNTVYLCNQHTGTPLCQSNQWWPAMFPNMSVDTLGHILLTGSYSLMRHPYVKVAHFTSNLTIRDEGEGGGEETNSD